MFKPIVCFLAAAALVLGSTSAEAAKGGRKLKLTPEQVFAKRDKDKDGKLSLKEFVGKRKGAKAEAATRMFAIKDANHDNYLSLEEFKTHVKKSKKR